MGSLENQAQRTFISSRDCSCKLWTSAISIPRLQVATPICEPLTNKPDSQSETSTRLSQPTPTPSG